MDLLLLSDGQMHHYVLFRNLRSLIHKVKERVVRADNHICRNCFHVCTSKKRYEKHLELCLKNKPAIVRLPKNTKVYYKKFQSRWFAPNVGFFDLESIFEPVSGCQNNTTKSETRTKEVHKPCSYAMLFVAQSQTERFHFECLTGPKFIEQFVQSLETIAKRVHSVKQQHKYFPGPPLIAKEVVANCWICEEPLEHFFKNPTVLDHCHYTGEFLGWADNTCNINRRFLNYTPLFAHNLSNYDLHLVILALQGSNMRNTVSIFPNADEKYIALEIGVLVYNRQDKNGVIKPVYEYIRLLDSFRFMASSLDSLAQKLPSDQFTQLEHHF